MTTRQKILEQSLTMFNEEGVEKITTRHIAMKLKMSQGNLHYHFPNKDQIILELLKLFLTEIKDAAKYVPNQLFEKQDVLESMSVNFKVMYNYRFLFKDNEVVWRRIPSVKEIIVSLLAHKKEQIEQIIEYYKEQGIFRDDISDDQIKHLADQFLFTIGTWLGAGEYMGVGELTTEYFSKFIFRLWFPYLTHDEMKKWEVHLNSSF